MVNMEHNATATSLQNETYSNYYDGGNYMLSPWLQAVKIMRSVCVPLIVAIGLGGNTLSLLVFSARSMKQSSCSVFLAALAAVDNIFLLSIFLTWIDGEVHIILTTDIVCQLLVYVTYITSFLSVWFIVGFTCERCIAIRFPLKRNFMCTVRREKIAVLVLTLIACVIYNFSFWTSGMQSWGSEKRCLHDISYFEFLNIVTWIDTFLTMIFPFFIIVCVNFQVLRTVMRCSMKSRTTGRERRQNITFRPCPVRMQRKLKTDKEQTSATKLDTVSESNDSESLEEIPSAPATKQKFTGSKHPHFRVTRTLLFVSTTFLCLNLPSHVIRLYNLITTLTSEVATGITPQFYFLQELTLMLYYTTFSCNFVLYTLFGKNFKKSLKLILRCKSTMTDHRKKLLRRVNNSQPNITNVTSV